MNKNINLNDLFGTTFLNSGSYRTLWSCQPLDCWGWL